MSEDEETEQDEDQDVYQILARDYPPEIVAPYGVVLPIPEVDWNEDWHTELKEKGYKLYPSSLRGHMVMLVKDPHNQTWGSNVKMSESELKVKEAEIIPKTRKRWTQEEDQIVLDMTQQGMLQKEIADKLGRSLNSVLNHLQVMRGQRKKGKWLDIEKSDILVPKTDLEGPSVPKSDSTPKVDSNPKFDAPETNEVFKELLMVAGQLYPNYKSVIRILLNQASNILGS